MKGEVLVAMSGGVDSSVTAALLKDQGYSVTGVTLKLWGGDSDSGCCSVSDVDDARRVAHLLGIEHHVFNFGEEFDRHVIDHYVDSHESGLTPNPCIECNRHIKFAKLLDRADALGFDLLATGHHARVVELGDGTRRIARGADAAKDQSYVLYMLDQAQLARLSLPLGAMVKDDVRKLASELGMVTADKPDSQDVCFIHSAVGREQFLSDRLTHEPADVVDSKGAKIGTAPSVQMVTIGQRRGMRLGGGDSRRYVVDVDRAANKVTVGGRDDLLVESTSLVDVSWVGEPSTDTLFIQFSAHGTAFPGRVVDDVVVWEAPVRRVAPGQAVVFFVGDEVVGGGLACRSVAPAEASA